METAHPDDDQHPEGRSAQASGAERADEHVSNFGLEEFGADPSDEGLSLEELSRAYAEAIDSGADPYEEPIEQDDTEDDDALDVNSQVSAPIPSSSSPEGSAAESEAGSEEASGSQSRQATQADDDSSEFAEDGIDQDVPRSTTDETCQVTPRSILEAMLFVGHPENRPLTSREIAALMRGVRPNEIDDLVQELNDFYHSTDAPYWVRGVEAGYVMQLRPELEGVRDAFYGRVKAAKLSQAAIDVLAIVAYNQPATKEEVESLRNRPSAGMLNQLVRRGLLLIERVPDQPRVRRYRTTERFLHLFQLVSLAELPRSQDVE